MKISQTISGRRVELETGKSYFATAPSDGPVKRDSDDAYITVYIMRADSPFGQAAWVLTNFNPAEAEHFIKRFNQTRVPVLGRRWL